MKMKETRLFSLIYHLILRVQEGNNPARERASKLGVWLVKHLEESLTESDLEQIEKECG